MARYAISKIATGIFFTGLSLVFSSAFAVDITSPEKPAFSAKLTAEQLAFFENSVRPLLVENCFSCHAAKKQKGDLRLDSAASIKAGGKNGPVIVPGKPTQSRLIEVVSGKDPDVQMPPDEKLTEAQVEILAQWVQMGAPWPDTGQIAAPLAKSKNREITSKDRGFWSFQPLSHPAVPDMPTGYTGRNPIDNFIFATLKQQNLKSAPEADRVTLIRRLTFDLHGLPPTADEVDSFVNDQSEHAYENLIDRLLASPRYGEHWARHWLDLVRYAESDGYKKDDYRPNAWPYRDYVISSFNSDKPYDQFVAEQLAGDEINPTDPKMIVATGYIRAGVYEYNLKDVRTQWDTILTDITDVTGEVMMGLSMGCAKCHNHKFDPILQKDYYQLRSVFAPMSPRMDLDLATPAELAAHEKAMAEWKQKTGDLHEQIDALEKPVHRKKTAGIVKMFPPDIQVMINKKPEDRLPFESQMVNLAARQFKDEPESAPLKLTGTDAEKHKALVAQLAKSEKDKPSPLLRALVTTDIGPIAPPTVIPGYAKNEALQPGFPTVLSQLTPSKNSNLLTDIQPSDTSTGRRTALAKWIARKDNALTHRVIVNRIWQYHFGRGIVGTSNDFGILGDRPSHPELLDWLTDQFINNGRQFKSMHRLILTSAAYRQSSQNIDAVAAKLKDPENRLLWRASTRRLDAEQIRDGMLLLSGQLSPEFGGPSADHKSNRRSIYLKVLRNTRDPLLDVFDAPETFSSVCSRNCTTTAAQALLMINGPQPLEYAKSMANRLIKMDRSDNSSLVEEAYRMTYARVPTNDERKWAIAFLAGTSKTSTDGKADMKLIDFCHVLLNSNEFLFVD